MEIAKASGSSGTLSAVTGSWKLAKDAASGRFVQRFNLSLQTGGMAERIVWEPTSSFSLAFPTYEYDALATSAPEAASLTDSKHGVKVKFPTVRTIVRVKVKSAHSSDTMELRRVVAGTIADDPFAAVPYQSEGLVLDATELELELRRTVGNLPASSIASVTVSSVAANVRIGVGFSLLDNELFYLSSLPAPFSANPSVATDLGPALSDLLQSISGRLVTEGKLLPATISLTLSIESDSPAQANISAFALRCRLQRRCFDDGAPKRVLEFPGGQLTTREVVFGVPRGSGVSSAKLRFMGAFDQQNESEAQGSSSLPQAVAASDVGVEVLAREAVATRLALQQAALVDGATLEVATLGDATVAHVQLRADAEGQPGEVLATGSLPIMAAGVRRVARVDFEQAGLSSAGPAWLSVECVSGALLWLAMPQGEGVVGSALLRRSSGDVVWSQLAAPTSGTVASLVTRRPPAGADATGDAFHGVRVFHAGQRLLGSRPQAGTAGERETHFEVAKVIEGAVLAGAAGTLVPITIEVRSSERGRVSVYPPEVEFEP